MLFRSLQSFTTTARSATVVTGTGDLQITHQYQPSTNPDLYAVNVTVERTGATSSEHVLYRRTVDFDVAPTPFNEYITWAKTPDGDDSHVLTLTNNGFASSNPTDPASHLGSVGYVERYGPTDQGGLIDIDLGPVRTGTPVHFTLFFGVSTHPDDARAAVQAVGSDVYLLGEPSEWTYTPSSTDPLGYLLKWNTAVFAFRADELGTDEPSSQRRTLDVPTTPTRPPVELGVTPHQSVGGSS